MAISLFVGVWIVRYFGPEYFGKFNYVTAWLTLMAAMVPLGTESILVAELVKNSENKDSILASSFFLYLVTRNFFYSNKYRSLCFIISRMMLKYFI
jgi:O-antigen/teichoic acid export membrane protein